MKRFYRKVAVEHLPAGYGVTLDAKPVRTPAKVPLRVPTASLAEAVAVEWEEQAETIRPETMPLTQLSNTAIDRVALVPDAVIDEILRFAETDLLCYRAAAPADLVARQASQWQPLLDWAAEALAARLHVTAGVLPVPQPPASVAALRGVVAAADVFALTALAELTASCGSAVLAIAVWRGRIDGADAAEAALVDHVYQAERYGEDAEEGRRLKRLRHDIHAAARFLSLLAA